MSTGNSSNKKMQNYQVVIAIFASVRNRASSKIKLVKPSVKLEDHVILSNNTHYLIEQKGT